MIPSKEKIEKYIEDGLSQNQIKDIYKVSQATVSLWFKKYGLKSKIKTGGAHNVKDLTGRKFGDLTVLSYAYTDDHGKNYLCKCKCGNEKIYRGSTLTSGVVTGCGCNVGKSNIGLEHPEKAMSHIGERYGRLEIIDICKCGNQYEMVCKCDCGEIKNVKYFDLESGKVKSCGCWQKEQASRTGSTIGLKNYKNNYNWYFIKDEQKVRCRSGYEVIYANWLMKNDIDFEYEPRCFKIGNGKRYTPDFYLVKTDEWIEIKGSFRIKNGKSQKEKIDIFSKTHNHIIMYWNDIVSICKLPYRAYRTYFSRANKSNTKIEDYLANRLYL